MIIPYESNFLSPTKFVRRLSILHVIHDQPDVSQHTIGRMTHLSSSMVNNYIKWLRDEGLIRVEGATNRTQSYHLTSAGNRMLRDSLLSYSAEIVQMYGSVKREMANILNEFYSEGIRTVVLFGAAETAEVVHAALKETDLVMIGVVDSDSQKQGCAFNGFVVKVPEELKKINPDAVVITSFAYQEEIYEDVLTLLGPDVLIKKLSDIDG
jgi:predicted transcriptional regulator